VKEGAGITRCQGQDECCQDFAAVFDSVHLVLLRYIYIGGHLGYVTVQWSMEQIELRYGHATQVYCATGVRAEAVQIGGPAANCRRTPLPSFADSNSTTVVPSLHLTLRLTV
jgi:hypothetical protein